MSPFGGNAKLPWNLEWAAQWSLFGVTIEPNGKDLATAGGSRDRSNAIAREVFEREPPRNFPYEFLNIGGRKMSTSKGRGAAAHTIGSVIPPEQLRFLFVRQRPESALDFDPEGTDAIPRLFDEFDRLGAATAGREVKGELPSGHESIFRYSLLDPDADVAAAAARVPARVRPPRAARPDPGHRRPGAGRGGEGERPRPTTSRRSSRCASPRSAAGWRRTRRSGRSSRSSATRCRSRWSSCAPSSVGFLRSLTEVAHGEALASGEQWQAAIFAVAQEHGVDAKAAFNALYLAFLGRPNGPRAGWLLASLERDFVIRRLTEAGTARGGFRMSVGVQRLRDEPERIRQGAIDKREDPSLVDRAIEADAERRRLQSESDQLKAERNTASKQIGETIRGGATPDGPEVAELRARSTAAGQRIDAIDAELAATEQQLEDLLLRIPNPADPEVPVGGEEANVTVRTWGEQGSREETAADGTAWTRRPHWELGESLAMIDNVRGAKVAGSGFPVYKGAGSRLQRSLISWFLDVHTTEHGFTEVWPPAVVNTASARGTGPDPGQGRPDVRRHPRRAVPGPHRRGPGHEPATATRSSRRTSCPSGTRPTRRAGGARRAPPARTPGASSASTSSTRSRWCCSRSRRTAPRRSSG